MSTSEVMPTPKQLEQRVHSFIEEFSGGKISAQELQVNFTRIFDLTSDSLARSGKSGIVEFSTLGMMISMFGCGLANHDSISIGEMLISMIKQIPTGNTTNLPSNKIVKPNIAFVQNAPAKFTIGRQNQSSSINITELSKNIFVVHGHDMEPVHETIRLIEDAFDARCIVLKEQTSKGRLILEKFLEVANTCSYAVAVYSADDEVCNSGEKYMQARPNVIFEMGWFYGKLGKEKIAVLLKKGAKLNSDLHGLNYLEYDSSVREKFLDLSNELEDAGFKRKSKV